MERYISFLGLFVMIGLAWLMSSHKRIFPWRVVIGGLVLQFLFAWMILKTSAGQQFFVVVDNAFKELLGYVDEGASFVFGANFAEHPVAFRVLPSIIFFSALMQVLYYLGIMQQMVHGMGYIVQRTLGTTGAESLAAAANIFVGPTEAPLVVRPYIHTMTKSELMAVMVPGFGSTAGGVLITYISMGISASHLLTASVLSAPASLLIAKILLPETEKSLTEKDVVKVDAGERGANVLDAISIGTLEGLKLALNVGAMLIAFIALIAMVNGMLGWLGSLVHQTWSLEGIFGWLFAPIAYIMGIPWRDCTVSGQLLGIKMVVNEFIAYDMLGTMIKDPNGTLDQRSIVILTYALCGFANFGSIGIQIGGIGGMAPERRRDLAQLGLRAMLGGALANFMTACVAGILL